MTCSRRSSGPPIRGTFGTLLATSDRELIERATSLYREQYGVSGLFENRVYDGVAEMLDRVGPMAAATFVATLKPKPYADRIVQRLGLDRYFAGVYGTALEERFGEKVALLAHLLETERLSAANAAMIGDRVRREKR